MPPFPIMMNNTFINSNSIYMILLPPTKKKCKYCHNKDDDDNYC